MTLISRKPQPPLSDFVRVLWLAEQYSPGPHRRERILPSGNPTLIVDLREDGTATLSGPHSRSFLLDTAAQFFVAGVEFHPGRAYPIVGIPLSDIANTHVPLDALWGGIAAELRERMLECHDQAARLCALESVLWRRLTLSRQGHPAVAHAVDALIRDPGTARIAEVTARVGLSQRRFVDLFTAEVGLTPKVFCRIHRFQRVLSDVRAGRAVNWAAVAACAGYYDQSHLIKEFQEFSGLNPSSYQMAAGSHQNHVPVAD